MNKVEWNEFLNLKGDVAATAEFIRVYRTRFRALDQPLFICGESYGVFRAAALADLRHAFTVDFHLPAVDFVPAVGACFDLLADRGAEKKVVDSGRRR